MQIRGVIDSTAGVVESFLFLLFMCVLSFYFAPPFILCRPRLPLPNHQ